MRILFLLLALTSNAFAQTSNCGGLTSVRETTRAVYPPIAKAAHVWGTVILLASFEPSGTVSKIDVVSGPQMLRESAVAFVKGWMVNQFTGPRTCPIVVEYVSRHVDCFQDAGKDILTRSDPQHVILEGGFVPLCDPAADISRKRRLLHRLSPWHWF